ncbi:MAG: signal peptidase II [Gemmatimonadales bacterium]|nr:signal peptidase II [Gemmatimonadales bacterium]
MVSAAEQRRFVGVVSAVIVLDLATKLIAESFLPRYVGVPVIGEFFQLRLVYNPGAAFGLNVGEYSRWIFMGLSFTALFVLGSMLKTTRSGDWLRLYALASICAGAAGNLVDRVRSSKGVVDFLDFTVGSLHWPTFNVADMAVTCGAFALAISLWGEGKQPAPAVPAPEAVPPAGS